MAGLGNVHAQRGQVHEAMLDAFEHRNSGGFSHANDGTTFVVVWHYVYSARVTPTRTRSLDAAIDLLGTEGLRALTHVRVDERAGLPKGSTSNHFRTREALLLGVVDWIATRELPPVGAAFSPASAADLVDSLCGLLDFTTVANRTLTTARLVLFMEASHDAALREALSRGRAAMTSSVVPALAQLGVDDPVAAAEAIAACFEGLILHRIARHDTSDPRRTFELLVNSVIPA
jgi:AcrR family transcriptional regulator